MSCLQNPPAFPRPASRGFNYITGEEDATIDPQEGMMLMDYFAGQVVLGLATQSDETCCTKSTALRAYKIAHDMLDARKLYRS